MVEEQELLKIRPQTLDDFSGQDKLKRLLGLTLEASKDREEVPPHILLHGPAGFGKTTLAYIIANEMGLTMLEVHAPSVEKSEELAAQLSSIRGACVVFVDEIHRLKKRIQESLYRTMEDFVVMHNDVLLQMPKFCFIGATTEFGTLTSPMRDRFGLVIALTDYSDEEIGKIIARTSKVLQIAITEDACELIASRSRTTPRVANKLIATCRDVAQMNLRKVERERQEARKDKFESEHTVASRTLGQSLLVDRMSQEMGGEGIYKIDRQVVDEAFDVLGIDSLGLTEQDRDYLKNLVMVHGGGPAGVEAISLSANIDEVTISDVIEPHLMRKGLIARAPRGREITSKGTEHLGMRLG